MIHLELNDIRNEIDSIDQQLKQLLQQRMKLSKQVAQYKLKNNIEIFNPQRENQILNSMDENGEYHINKVIFSVIMNASKLLQEIIIGKINPTNICSDETIKLSISDENIQNLPDILNRYLMYGLTPVSITHELETYEVIFNRELSK